jgi:hypothetical protein
MADKKLHSIKTEKGFILPVTMSLLLFLSLFCFQRLYQLDLNQSELKEQQLATQTLFLFQSAAADLKKMMDTPPTQAGDGTLTEYNTQVSYSFKFISTAQVQINLSYKTPSDSTLSVSYVYNKDTKQIEQWVNQ